MEWGRHEAPSRSSHDPVLLTTVPETGLHPAHRRPVATTTAGEGRTEEPLESIVPGERADLQAGPALRRAWRTITRDRDQAQAKLDETRSG
jgi:hypothetical protein